MSPSGFPLSRIALMAATLGSLASAAKTVILRNPWTGTDVPPYPPSIYLASSGGSANLQATFSDKSYWSYTFAATVPGDFFFVNLYSTGGYYYGANGLGTNGSTPTRFNLDAQFASRDTVWILPDTTNPTPRLATTTSTDPMGTRRVILLRSPWSGTPSFQVNGQGWNPFALVATSSGWYSARLGDLASLKLGIRDYSAINYLGSFGTTISNATVLDLDTALAKNDTIWIYADLSKAPKVTADLGGALVVMLKNPWATTNPGVAPAVWFDPTGPWNAMSAATGWPDWYSAKVPSPLSGMSFRSGTTGTSYVNLSGFGTASSTFLLDTAFLRNDTAWVVPSAIAGPSVGVVAPAGRPVTLMLRSPWDSLDPGRAPTARIENADWTPFAAARDGWQSLSTTLWGNRLLVSIRSGSGNSYLGPYGLTSSLSASLALDSALAKNDTIWIVPQLSNPVLALSAEPSPRRGVLMLLNPWEATYPGLPPRLQVESQGQATMVAAPSQPGWYAAPVASFASLMVSFWDNAKMYQKGPYLLDTALARNDTIWVAYPANSTAPRVYTSQPAEKTVTILFKSPWDSAAPFAPGSLQVEGRAWTPLAPLAGSPGWYVATVSFFAILQVAIRDSKATSFLYGWGTTTSANTLLLDTAFARNDTIWIVGGAGSNVPIQVAASAPSTRPLTLMLQSPWESATAGAAPSVLVNGRNWQAMSAHPSLKGWYSASMDFYGSLVVQVRNAAKDSYLYYGGTIGSNSYSLQLDTAYARNDTLWLHRASNGSMVAVPAQPAGKPVTILFKSPWDSSAPYAAGQFQVEGRGWKSLVAVAGSPGWYAGSDSFLGSLQVSIRDSKGTSYVAYNGTTTLSSSLQLDTAWSKNDTVWIVGSAAYGTPTGVFVAAPPVRSLTLVLQNPWEASSPGAAPSLLVNGKNWQAFSPVSNRSGWYAASTDFHGILSVQIRNAARNSYLYYGGTTSSSGSFLVLDTALARNDTIWILSSAAWGPRIFSKDPDPRSLVVMLDNPWQATTPVPVPQLSDDGSNWTPMVPVAGDSGWYSAKLVYVEGYPVGIRMGSSYTYLGPKGITPIYAPLSLDDFYRKNDTVWITRTRDGKPPTLRAGDPRKSKVLMVFNPWDGTFPLQRPVAFVGADPVGRVLVPSLENCGWYFLEVDVHPKEIVFRSSRTGEAYGAAGLGSVAPLDLSGQLTDSVWIAPASGGPGISHLPSRDRGSCAIALVGATVRDFQYSLLASATSGVATNLVTGVLGPDRKPVIRRNSPGLPMQAVWFRDSTGLNASTCRDLAMSLDTLTGIYRMANPSFYPVDDFLTLPGGGANPYNDKASLSYGNNNGFCLEAHGQFRYRRGQQDTISGQDDIFHYLNGKLVANLGGTHGTMVQAVGLDTLGLVDGNVYPWDLFFCDRASGSSVLDWTMPAMLSSPIARVDSSWSGGASMLRVSAVEGLGQGCGRTETLSPTRGTVRLRALYDSLWTDLPTGVHYGGIRVLDSTGVQVDTSLMTGLPYGIYVVRLRSTRDSMVFRDLVFQVEAPPGMHPYAPNARCDLRSGPMRSTVGCLDLDDLDGDTLRISKNTTRLSTEGLVLCGGASTVVAGTDIAYLQDNSGSMGGNDPTKQRGNVVRDAIELHSQIAPSSYAAYLPFASSFTATQLYNITDPMERADIINSITLGSGGGTSYAGALGWARALLEGATSGAKTMPASPNANKAIIVISDGEPGDEVASNDVLLPNATTRYQNETWTLPADTSVPVFGFMITQSSTAATTGRVLYDITQKTGGEFFVIPPGDADSLRSAMLTVLGSIVARARPDTLRIANLTNGQVSRGLSGGREGGGWRFRLDSLVGLEPGVNHLQLRGVFFTDRGDSVVKADWTVIVGDTLDEFVVGGRDTTLMLACSAPTQLKVRPALDSARHFADSRDATISFWLDARYDKLLQNTIQFWTDVSGDSGRKTTAAATTADAIRAYSAAAVQWTGLVVSRRDSTVQTDVGWDTLRAVYRTPRDRRDTAVGFLPVFRNWPVSVRFEPDTVQGAKGELSVIVRDPNLAADSVRVKVFQNRRDSVWVTLRRDSTSQFRAKVPFAQGAAVVAGDSLLQAGPYRVAPLDSVFALYLSNRDTAILRRPDGRLRWVDAAGRILDSLAGRSLPLGGVDTLRVGLFLDTLLLSTSTDSVLATVPGGFSLRTLAGAANAGRMRLVSGKVSFTVVAVAPGADGDVRIVRPAGPDTLVRRLGTGGLRLRFLAPDGTLSDSARVDRDVRSDTLLRLEVWDGGGLCGACDGWLTDSVSDRAVRFLDSLGRPMDSVAIRGGRAVFRLVSETPVTGASVALVSAGLRTRGVVAPVTFRPFRLRFVDGSGRVVDSAAVDRDRMSDTLLAVEVWGSSGRCASCAGSLSISSSSGLQVRDSTGKSSDSVRISGGRGVLRIGSDKALEGGKVELSGDLLGSPARVSPVTFRPFRLRFVDGAGRVVDSAAVVRDQMSDTLLVVEIWGRSGRCASCAGSLSISASSGLQVRDSTGRPMDSVRISGGRGVLRIGSDKALEGGKVDLSGDLLGSTATVTPVTFRPFRLRFVDGAGQVVDSLRVDTLARRAVRVEAILWGASGAVRWSGLLRVDSAGADVQVTDTFKRATNDLAMVDGRAVFLLRSDAPRVSRPRLSIDSLGLVSGSAAVSWRVPAPDSAILLDVDGDGGLDRVLVRFSFPWHPDNQLAIRWPDSATTLDLAGASRHVSADSLSVEWSFQKAQSPRTTAWRGEVVPARFAWNASAASSSFATRERIAPIAVRARILRGETKDTLVVWASEPLDPQAAGSGTDLVRRIHPISNRVPFSAASWDPRRQALLVAIDRASIDSLVQPTDSVRFAPGSSVRDAHGAAVGDFSPAVEVEGLDQAPIGAVVLDTDADGRADRVVVRWASEPKVADNFRFAWPSREGRLQVREASLRDGRKDSSGRVVSFAVEPWEFGATQCDSTGCDDLGLVRTNRWGDTLQTRFALEDGVLAVVLKAQLRFRRRASDPDTLRALLSEAMEMDPKADWLRYGRPSRDSLGSPIERLGQDSKARRVLELLLDSTFTGGERDSIRLSAWPQGGLQDVDGNRPGRFVHWTPLEVGTPRPKLAAMVWPDLARFTGWNVPSGEPPLSVFVRSGAGTPWKSLEGKAPGQETSHYAGILLKANKSLEGAVLYLYDNMGVAVAHVDLTEVQKALRENRVETALRGDLDVWVAWNGKSRTGAMAPSGIYLARVMGWVVVDGRREMINQVYNLGWHNPFLPAPPPDLDFLPQYDWTGW